QFLRPLFPPRLYHPGVPCFGRTFPPPYPGMQGRKSLGLSCRDQPQAEAPQVRMPFENRTAQTPTATTMEPTIASHSVYGAVSGISFPNDSRIASPLRA